MSIFNLIACLTAIQLIWVLIAILWEIFQEGCIKCGVSTVQLKASFLVGRLFVTEANMKWIVSTALLVNIKSAVYPNDPCLLLFHLYIISELNNGTCANTFSKIEISLFTVSILCICYKLWYALPLLISFLGGSGRGLRAKLVALPKTWSGWNTWTPSNPVSFSKLSST